MATRAETQSRRQNMYESLLRSCREGNLAPGEMLPGMRELGQKYGLSAGIAFQVIQKLVDEGVLHTVPRVGAFVGPVSSVSREPFLMVIPYHPWSTQDFWIPARHGFEDRIAELGGTSLVLSREEAHAQLEKLTPGAIAGVFEALSNGTGGEFADLGFASVCFGDLETRQVKADHVAFDDREGGARAARHLWQMGHRGIAFLAMHHSAEDAAFYWSHQREAGWREAMNALDCPTQKACFRPKRTPGFGYLDQMAVSGEASLPLLNRPDITAVVAANFNAAEGMLRTFREAGFPPVRWPAVLYFDAPTHTPSHFMSYMRLPWEAAGREAAQLLWDRRHGNIPQGFVQRRIPMKLIARLSCAPEWTQASALARDLVNARQPGPAAPVTPCPV